MDDLFGDLAPSSSKPQSQPQSQVATAASAQPAATTTASFEDEEYDSVLFVARECYVYRLPARTSTAGYKAGDWVSALPCRTARWLRWSGQLTRCGTNARRETWRRSSGKVGRPRARCYVCACSRVDAAPLTGRCRVIEVTKGSTSRVVVRLEDSNTGRWTSHYVFVQHSERASSAALHTDTRFFAPPCCAGPPCSPRLMPRVPRARFPLRISARQRPTLLYSGNRRDIRAVPIRQDGESSRGRPRQLAVLCPPRRRCHFGQTCLPRHGLPGAHRGV